MEINEFKKDVIDKSLMIIDEGIKKGYLSETDSDSLINKLITIFGNNIEYDIPGKAIYGMYVPSEQKLYFNVKVLKDEEEALIYVLHEMKHGLDHSSQGIGFQISNEKNVGMNEGATQRFATDIAEEILHIKIPEKVQKSLGIELVTNLDEYQIEDKLNELFCHAIGITRAEFLLAQNQGNKQLYNNMVEKFNQYANFDVFNTCIDEIYKIQEETWVDKNGNWLEVEAPPTEEQTQRATELIKKCQEQILQYVQKSNPNRLSEIKEELIMPMNEYGEIVRNSNQQNLDETENLENEQMSPRDMLYQIDYMKYQDFLMNGVDLGDNTLVFISGLDGSPFEEIYEGEPTIRNFLQSGNSQVETIYVRNGEQYKKCSIEFDATGALKISDYENIDSTDEILDAIEYSEVIGNAPEYIKILQNNGKMQEAQAIQKKYEYFLQNKDKEKDILQEFHSPSKGKIEMDDIMEQIRNGVVNGLSIDELLEPTEDENYRVDETGAVILEEDFKETAEDPKSIEKIGGSICFQLIDIFNIIEDNKLTEERKKEKIEEYQASLTQEGKGTLIDPERKDGQNKKNGYFVFGDIDGMSYEDLVKTKQHVDNHLTSLTCEAEMKMTALISGYDKDKHEITYSFEKADKVYQYAMTHGKAMRGHTLVWHNHQPPALDEFIQDNYDGNFEQDKITNPEKFKAKRKELTKLFLSQYMKTVGERYPGCYCWDVLNEIVPDVHKPETSQEKISDGLRLRHSKWFDYLGPKFYIDVLEIARENLPEGTKLFYNEYGEQNPDKRKAIINVIKDIIDYEQKNKNVLLDGIGLQSHYDLNTTEQQIEDIYEDFSSTGKEIQITEMDVAPGYDEQGHFLTYDPNKTIQYSKIWNKVLNCARQKGVKSFTGWGISDGLSWFRNIGCTMVKENGEIKDFAKEFFEEETTKSKISFQEVGESTVDSFEQNPGEAQQAISQLETGVKLHENSKEEKNQGEI